MIKLAVKVSYARRAATTPISRKASGSSDIVIVKSEANSTDKNRKPTLKDIPAFYRDKWSSHFIPMLINWVGADPKPWDPTFNITTVLQEIRDTIYEDYDHVIDEGGWLDRLVSYIYYL